MMRRDVGAARYWPRLSYVQRSVLTDLRRLVDTVRLQQRFSATAKRICTSEIP
jgi:hypothetical protein